MKASNLFVTVFLALPISILAQEPSHSIHELMLEAHRDEAPVVLRKAGEVIPLINRAHGRGVRIDLVATLFDDNAIHNLIANSTARDRFINNAIAEVKRGADGLNIDFEFSPPADRALWTAFMNELAIKMFFMTQSVTDDAGVHGAREMIYDAGQRHALY